MTGAAADPAPPAGRVDVWTTELDQPPAVVERLHGLLDDAERVRAAGFHAERDARRFVVGRAVLRQVLGACLGVAPQAVRFAYGAQRKPALAPPLDAAGLQFNVSHSGGIALHAVGRHRRLGIDVEQLRALDDLETLAARYFSPAECRTLLALPPPQRVPGFFACWTRKEAYVKALGDGLVHPLSAFTVSLAPGDPVRFIEIDGDRAAAAAWTLQALEIRAGYAAAVAVDGPATVTVRGDWPGRNH